MTAREVHRQVVANHLAVCHRHGESIGDCPDCQSFRGPVRKELERILSAPEELAALLTEAIKRHDGYKPAPTVADFKERLQRLAGPAPEVFKPCVRTPESRGYYPPPKTK